MNDPLLSYAIETDPDPLQASVSKAEPSTATLTITVSNGTHKPIQCKSIGFSFPIGKNAKDFSEDMTGVACSQPTGWSFNQVQRGLFEAQPDTDAAGKIGGEGLTFVLSNIKVNQQPGTFDLTITEEASVGANPPVPASLPATKIVELPKFPPQFEVGDLKAQPLIVAQGESVLLSWRGTAGATYELEYVDAHGSKVVINQTEDGHPLPSTGSYTIENIERETIFYLIVTMTVTGQNKPITMQRTCIVSVTESQPQITLFEGKLDYSPGGITLTVNWDTSINTDHCTVTGKDSFLKRSSTDDSCHIELKKAEDLDKAYKLTAVNKAGTDTSEIVLRYETKLLMSTNSAVSMYAPSYVAASPDNTRLYVSCVTRLWVLDTHTLQRITDVDVGYSLGHVAVSPDGTRVYVSCEGNGITMMLDAQTLKRIGEPLGYESTGVAVSPDGTRLYLLVEMSISSMQLSVLDAHTLRSTGESFTTQDRVYCLAVSPDGARLYLGGSTHLSVVDAQTLKLIEERSWAEFSWWPSCMAVSPDNTRLYVMSIGGPQDNIKSLWVFSTDSLSPVAERIPVDQASEYTVWVGAVAPDNTGLYMPMKDNRVGKYSIASVTGGKARAGAKGQG